MLRLFLALTITIIVFPSCKQPKTSVEKIIAARSYFDSITYQYKLTKALNQKIIDKATEIILIIKDKTSTIDTKEIKFLIDSAKANNNSAIRNIEKITEIDEAIGYKSVVIEYLMLFSTFYNTELKDLLKLVEEKDEDAHTKGSKFMLPKLKMIKDKEFDFVNTREAFRVKYPVGSDGNIHTNPDFEFVNFSDFKYEEANLNEGEEISLISYSGGKDCDTETKYYEQFIGISKSREDTVRILVPCQSYDDDNISGIGYYRKIVSDSIHNTFLGKSLIVFNKHLTNIEKKDFKTAVGVLVFRD